jgi:phosphate:Na+ symporter
VIWLVKEPKGETEVFRLKYIAGGPLSTAELSLNEAQQELIHFAEICRNGFGYIRQAINEQDPEKFDKLNEKLIKYEEISDRIEYEIATYLNEVGKNEISEEAANTIKSMYKIIKELESLGDSGEVISRILSRRNIHNKTFDEDTIKKLEGMADAVDNAYDAMIANLIGVHKGTLVEVSNAYNAEDRINNLRNDLRDSEIEEIENNRKTYQTSVYYIDIVNQLERMGDFIINISQELEKTFIRK